MAVPPSSVASSVERAPPIFPKAVRPVPRMTVLLMGPRIDSELHSPVLPIRVTTADADADTVVVPVFDGAPLEAPLPALIDSGAAKSTPTAPAAFPERG